MLVRDIEPAIQAAEQSGVAFNPSALSRSAIVHLLRRLERPADNGKIKVLELGGGQPTLLWAALAQNGVLPLEVVTLEHEPELFSELEEKVKGTDSRVFKQTLKQISGEQREQLFIHPGQSPGQWGNIGNAVSRTRYKEYSIQHTFYGEAHAMNFPPASIDVLIIDGPHGNGRSLCFPLFFRAIRDGALVLIDDFDHYPFLHDLRRLFEYEELYREINQQKRWVLVRILAHREQTLPES